MWGNSSSTNINSRYDCFDSPAGILISLSYTVIKSLLLLPLYVPVLYLGYRRWRRQRSSKTTSHSDVFTYHMAAMELIASLGDTVYYWGFYTGVSGLSTGGIYLSAVVSPGQLLIHCLTCVERYLAVLHPIAYMGLRQEGGVRIRNVSIGCVWLLSFGFLGVVAHYIPAFPDIPYFCMLSVSLIVVSFCSLSVLFALIRPGPGEVDRDRERVGQSKRKAFYTMVAILGVLFLWFAAFIVGLCLSTKPMESYIDTCLPFVSGFWFNIPSSLVLPMLFLHRAGKLPCY